VAFPARDPTTGSANSRVANGVAALAIDDEDLRETLQEIERDHGLRKDSRGVFGSGISHDGNESVISDASGISEEGRNRSSRSVGSHHSMGGRKRTRRRTQALGSILDAKPLTSCEHTTLSAFTVLNLVQVWAAFIGFLFCFYLVAGEAYNYAGPLRTIIIAVSSSVVFGTIGLFGYFGAR